MTAPKFDAPKLAEIVETLDPGEIDRLPFGVISLSPQNTVRLYNKTEQELSGVGGRPVIGRDFFVNLAPSLNNGYFKGRIDKARREGKLDITFNFVGDFCDQERELNVRVQAAKDGGLWIFHDRPGVNEAD